MKNGQEKLLEKWDSIHEAVQEIALKSLWEAGIIAMIYIINYAICGILLSGATTVVDKLFLSGSLSALGASHEIYVGALLLIWAIILLFYLAYKMAYAIGAFIVWIILSIGMIYMNGIYEQYPLELREGIYKNFINIFFIHICETPSKEIPVNDNKFFEIRIPKEIK